ncbi:hypothetical protein BD410DRAFT_797064, partial [Rickenella mellea]
VALFTAVTRVLFASPMASSSKLTPGSRSKWSASAILCSRLRDRPPTSSYTRPKRKDGKCMVRRLCLGLVLKTLARVSLVIGVLSSLYNASDLYSIRIGFFTSHLEDCRSCARGSLTTLFEGKF